MKTRNASAPSEPSIVNLFSSGLLLLLLSSMTAFAGSATWKLNPASGEWNTATNWTPQVIPNTYSDTATFATSNRTAVSISVGDSVEVGGIVFNAGANAFTINPQPFYLYIGLAGIANNSGTTQNFSGRIYLAGPVTASAGSQNIFTAHGASTSGYADRLEFGAGDAGNSTFNVDGGTVNGGTMTFSGSSTAADSLIVVNGGPVNGGPGGTLRFYDTSSAGNATLIADTGSGNNGNGAKIDIFGKSHADLARVKVFGTGRLDVAFHNKYKLDVGIGSIEGDGYVDLTTYGSGAGKNLIVGGNNLSTTFSGFIRGYNGGSLTKVGKGTLTLTCPLEGNDYDGTTTVKRGRLLVNNTIGSGTGQSVVRVDGGTLGGYGTIAGTVTVGTGSSSGAILLPGSSAKKPGNLTTNSALAFNSLSTYKCVLNLSNMTAGRVTALRVTINPNATFAFVETGTGTLSTGAVFTVINNTFASPISGTFSNLPDGATFTTNGNTFRADYTGGDGNDLTLTVVP